MWYADDLILPTDIDFLVDLSYSNSDEEDAVIFNVSEKSHSTCAEEGYSEWD
jgi:hypothetical protein